MERSGIKLASVAGTQRVLGTAGKKMNKQKAR